MSEYEDRRIRFRVRANNIRMIGMFVFWIFLISSIVSCVDGYPNYFWIAFTGVGFFAWMWGRICMAFTEG